MTPLAQVLDLARWAPSGDNTQPWRFSLEADDHAVVHAHDTRTHCVYDLDGHPSQISVGALLENIALAASRFGLRAHIARRAAGDDAHPVFDVRVTDDAGLGEHPLVASITERRVQRRPLRTTPLTSGARTALEAAVAPDYGLVWLASPRQRAAAAWLNFVSARIRLTIQEAYAVHRAVIEWDAVTSVDRVPAGALGASGASLRMMRWAMASWTRVQRLNRYAGGTLAPRIELDLLPGLACAAHVALVARQPPAALDDYVAAGRALQRFWLTATQFGLQFQPGYTPIIFARYAREGVAFTQSARALAQARDVARRLSRLLGGDVEPRTVFMGRIGYGLPAKARSLRLPLHALMVPGGDRPEQASQGRQSPGAPPAAR